MRLLPRISYGTEGYPEKIARRLRAMNTAAWIAAALSASFAIRRLADPAGDKLQPGLVNAAAALCLAALPLLHRFHHLAAPLVFVAFAYGFTFWVVSRGGTGGGAWLSYLAAIPLLVFLFGADYLLLIGMECRTAQDQGKRPFQRHQHDL